MTATAARPASRPVAVAVALMLAATGAGYVRRRYLPTAAPLVVCPDGSRDRHLSGKARIRARRNAR